MKNIEIVEWLKAQVEKKFVKDFNLKDTKAYLSCAMNCEHNFTMT